jgi:hypothetical protein
MYVTDSPFKHIYRDELRTKLSTATASAACRRPRPDAQWKAVAALRDALQGRTPSSIGRALIDLCKLTNEQSPPQQQLERQLRKERWTARGAGSASADPASGSFAPSPAPVPAAAAAAPAGSSAEDPEKPSLRSCLEESLQSLPQPMLALLSALPYLGEDKNTDVRALFPVFRDHFCPEEHPAELALLLQGLPFLPLAAYDAAVAALLTPAASASPSACASTGASDGVRAANLVPVAVRYALSERLFAAKLIHAVEFLSRPAQVDVLLAYDPAVLVAPWVGPLHRANIAGLRRICAGAPADTAPAPVSAAASSEAVGGDATMRRGVTGAGAGTGAGARGTTTAGGAAGSPSGDGGSSWGSVGGGLIDSDRAAFLRRLFLSLADDAHPTDEQRKILGRIVRDLKLPMPLLDEPVRMALKGLNLVGLLRLPCRDLMLSHCIVDRESRRALELAFLRRVRTGRRLDPRAGEALLNFLDDTVDCLRQAQDLGVHASGDPTATASLWEERLRALDALAVAAFAGTSVSRSPIAAAVTTPGLEAPSSLPATPNEASAAAAVGRHRSSSVAAASAAATIVSSSSSGALSPPAVPINAFPFPVSPAFTMVANLTGVAQEGEEEDAEGGAPADQGVKRRHRHRRHLLTSLPDDIVEQARRETEADASLAVGIDDDTDASPAAESSWVAAPSPLMPFELAPPSPAGPSMALAPAHASTGHRTARAPPPEDPLMPFPRGSPLSGIAPLALPTLPIPAAPATGAGSKVLPLDLADQTIEADYPGFLSDAAGFLRMPHYVTIKDIGSVAEMAEAADLVTETVKERDFIVIGVDSEWNAGTEQIDILTVCVGRHVFLIHLVEVDAIARKAGPEALTSVAESFRRIFLPSTARVSISIDFGGGDLGKLYGSYNYLSCFEGYLPLLTKRGNLSPFVGSAGGSAGTQREPVSLTSLLKACLDTPVPALQRKKAGSSSPESGCAQLFTIDLMFLSQSRLPAYSALVDDKRKADLLNDTTGLDGADGIAAFSLISTKETRVDGVVDEDGAVPKPTGGQGLAKVCAAVLGAPLCKYWQVSNWARGAGNILPGQAEYAAMDAWVLPILLSRLLRAPPPSLP